MAFNAEIRRKSALMTVYFLSGFSSSERTCDKEFIIRRAATNRVLNVLRHWVSKHSQVRTTVKSFLTDMTLAKLQSRNNQKNV